MAEIYHYRDYEKATQAWSNMERLHLMRKQGLIPCSTEPEMPCDVNPFEAECPFLAGDDCA